MKVKEFKELKVIPVRLYTSSRGDAEAKAIYILKKLDIKPIKNDICMEFTVSLKQLLKLQEFGLFDLSDIERLQIDTICK